MIFSVVLPQFQTRDYPVWTLPILRPSLISTVLWAADTVTSRSLEDSGQREPLILMSAAICRMHSQRESNTVTCTCFLVRWVFLVILQKQIILCDDVVFLYFFASCTCLLIQTCTSSASDQMKTLVNYIHSTCATGSWSERVWLDIEGSQYWLTSSSSNKAWYEALVDSCSTYGVRYNQQ